MQNAACDYGDGRQIGEELGSVGVTEAVAKPRLLINRNYSRLWLAGSLSVLGDFIFETTLVVWIGEKLAKDASWTGLAIAGVMIASTIPTLVVGPFAGVLVDRWPDKLRTMLRADALSALLTLALIPAAGIVALPFLDDGKPPTAVRLAAIYTVVFLASAIARFFGPSSSVLTRDIVPEPERARAAGMSQASQSLAMLIGPPLAAPLLFAAGAGWALVINAASFAASYLLVRTIVLPVRDGGTAGRRDGGNEEETVRGVFREMAEGIGFFRRSRVLVTLTVSLMLVMLGGGAMNALDYLFVKENLDTSGTYFGIVSSAQGVGMIGGAILSGMLAMRIGLERMVWGSLVTLGLLTVLFARMTHFWPAVVVVVAIGLAIPAINVAVGPLVMRVTPREYMGRVSATMNPLISAASLLGALVGGVLYSTVLSGFSGHAFGLHFGVVDTIYLGVGLLCTLGGIYAFVNLRRAVVETEAREQSIPGIDDIHRADAGQAARD